MATLILKSSTLIARQFSVVGTFHPPESSFVSHASITLCDQELSFGAKAEVCHTMPPIVITRAEQRGKRPYAHIVAWLDDLSVIEVKKIESWLESVQTEIPAWPVRRANRLEDYVAIPPYDTVYDKDNGRPIRRRFSCVGFVLACYCEAIKVHLLTMDEDRVPPLSLQEIRSIWGEQSANDLVASHSKYGLNNPTGPWNIMLPGYLFHSLARDSQEIRNVEFFPSKHHSIFRIG